MSSALLTPRGFATGHIPDVPDVRDRTYKIGAPAASVPYRFVDLTKTGHEPSIWNQSSLGSCTAHGTLAAFLFVASLMGIKDPMLSRLYLYWQSRNLEGTTSQDVGAQIRDAVRACTLGVPRETLWPYDVSKFAVTPPVKASNASKYNKLFEYLRVNTGQAGTQASLSAGYPVIDGATLFASFESDEALSTGLTPMPDQDDLEQGSIGGHCTEKVGIGTGLDWHKDGQFLGARLSDQSVYYKQRNSWGDDVYEKGYFLRPVQYSRYESDLWTLRKVS